MRLTSSLVSTDPPTFTKMAKLVRCVLLHWITVSLVLSSVLCSPSVDHAPFPILRVCSQATLRCVSSFTKTFTMLQIYNLHNHLRISKVPEYTAWVGIIFTKSLKCLNKVSLYLATQTVINMCAYTYILYVASTSSERQRKQLLNVTWCLTYQYEVHLHWVL